MIGRRDLVLAGLGVAALASAEALRPRRKLKLLKEGGTIEAALPARFGSWESQNADLVSPAQAGRLASTLTVRPSGEYTTTSIPRGGLSTRGVWRHSERPAPAPST